MTFPEILPVVTVTELKRSTADRRAASVSISPSQCKRARANDFVSARTLVPFFEYSAKGRIGVVVSNAQRCRSCAVV